ncbi:toll-like receptor Tollo [Zophobas morio]|uniref:toll-like receptor Tollo n=1 Tax=Zophobas morio TaxID=2755281 RepID=UPI0030833DA4
MHYYKFLLIFACCLSVNAVCEDAFSYKYVYKPRVYRFGFTRFYHDCTGFGTGFHSDRIRTLRFVDTQIITCSDASLNITLNYTYAHQAPNHHLIIANSTFPVIVANSSLFRFHGFKKLTLSKIGIEDIEIGALEHVQSVQDLNLSFNKLITIPEEILNTLTELRILDVSNNRISDLSNANFSNLVHLTHLTLAGNNIKDLHGNMFEGLVSLESIDISNNPLAKFEDVNFKSLMNFIARNTSLRTFDTDLSNFTLYSMDISNSNLEIINFDKLPKIQFLEMKNTSLRQIQNLNKLHSQTTNLRHNVISTLDEIPANIKELDLSYNKIKRVKYTKQSQQKSINTTSLNLAFNAISEIEPYVFGNLKLLRKLVVSNNNLEILHENTIVDCPSLTIVDFSFNKISHIKLRAFNMVPALSSLNLSHNKLKALNLDILPRGNKVWSLYINNNEITNLDVEIFQDVFSNVNWITINHNPWSCKHWRNILDSLQRRYIKINDVQHGKLYNSEGLSC